MLTWLPWGTAFYTHKKKDLSFAATGFTCKVYPTMELYNNLCWGRFLPFFSKGRESAVYCSDGWAIYKTFKEITLSAAEIARALKFK